MASTVPEIRLVRCPKCIKVLIEFASAPVYQCGGCDTTLRSKLYIATQENMTPVSVEMIASSSEVDNRVEPAAPSNSNYTESKAAINCYEKGESSNNGAQVIEERETDHNIPGSSNPLDLEGNTNMNQEAEKYLKLSPQGHDNLRLSDKMDESANPISQSVASEGDMVDREVGDSLRSITISSHAYDGSVSSADDVCIDRVPLKYRLLSKRTFRQRKVLDTSDSQGEKATENGVANEVNAYDGSVSSANDVCNDRVPHKYRLLSKRTFRQSKVLDTSDSQGKKANENGVANEVTSNMGSEFQSSNLRANSSNERHAASTASRSETESPNSDDFHSVQNWMEQEKESPSMFPLTDSVIHTDTFNCQNESPSTKLSSLKPAQMKILRKMDELRHELSELFDQTVEGKRKSQPRSLDSDLVPPPGSHLPRKNVHQRLQFSQSPLGGQTHCPCSHCHHQVFPSSVKSPPNVYCNNMFYQPSKDPQPHMESILPPPSQRAKAYDDETEKLQCKERRQPIKRHCLPVSGGAPFVICFKCLTLLQLPADFLLSKRRLHKLQCGACSEVLVYSFRTRAGKIPRTPDEAQHPSSEVESSFNAISRQEISAPHSNRYAQGEPFSFTEEYGVSFARSDSMEPETVLHVSRNSSYMTEEHIDEQMRGLQLHQLLGYSSARELLNQLSSRRPSDVSDTRYGLEGTGIRSHNHQHSAAGITSNSIEIHDEDELHRISRTRRGPSALPLGRLMKKGMQELNHGLEKVKLKIQPQGRIN